MLIILSSLMSFGWTPSLSNMPQSAISSIIPLRFYVNLTSSTITIYFLLHFHPCWPIPSFDFCKLSCRFIWRLHALLTLRELRHAQWPVTDTMKCHDWSEITTRICYLRGVLWTEEQAAVCILCSDTDLIYHGNGNLNCVVGGNGVI